MTRSSMLSSAAALAVLLSLSLPASAYWTTDATQGASARSAGGSGRPAGRTRYGHAEARRGASYGHRPRGRSSAGLSSPCAQARSMGGPCGCVASEKLFGHSVRELWLARNWLQFPRASPGPGTAAVWPGRHVEAVVASNGDGTVTTDGPYGTRRVSLRSVVIVDPHGSAVAGRGEGHTARHHHAYAWHRWRHRHYARV